jgi:hypothetical protein
MTIGWLRGLVLLVFLSVSLDAAEKKNAAPKVADLRDLVKEKPVAGTEVRLSPEWVGTVKRVYLRDPEKIHKEDSPSNVRLNTAVVFRHFARQKEPPLLQAVAMGKHGYNTGEAPSYAAKLPTVKEIAEAESLAPLKKWFGPQHGVTDGWGGRQDMHWTEGWTWFTFESATELRLLNVFAHVHGKAGADDAKIEILVIREGVFRPADPASAKEKAKFKTREEQEADEEAARLKELEKYPLPLRALLEVDGRPDDPDLKMLAKALNALRAKPDAKLIAQLVRGLGLGGESIRFHMLLEHLLTNDFVKLKAWEPGTKRAAQRALVAALSEVTSHHGLDKAIELLLRSMGGGTVRLRVRGTDAEVKVAVVLKKGGNSVTFDSSGITEGNLRQVVAATQQYLRAEFPELGNDK